MTYTPAVRSKFTDGLSQLDAVASNAQRLAGSDARLQTAALSKYGLEAVFASQEAIPLSSFSRLEEK